MLHCVVDINTLIHFQTFDEVDWCTVLKAHQVRLVLTPVVTAELDQHKDDRANTWRRKRARMLVSKPRRLLSEVRPGQPAPLRDDTFIVDIAQEPMVDWPALGLDQSVNDDRLLAPIIVYADQHPQERVVFVSDDFLAQRKAMSQGIQVVEPEGRIERIERPPPEVSTMRQLQQQIEILKTRIPELSLSFWENDDTANRVIRFIDTSKTGGPSDADIAEEISKKRQNLQQVIAQAGGTAVENEISRFSQDYDEYLENLGAYLKMTRARGLGQRCRLAFVLHNIGSAPALDVEVALFFPPGSHVVEASEEFDDLLFEAIAPKEPTPRWISERPLFPSLPALDGILASPRLRPPEQPKPEGPVYEDYYHRGTVYFTHPKLRHKEQWFMAPIVLDLPPAVRGGFQILYSVHADNLLSPIEGQLHVTLEPQGQALL